MGHNLENVMESVMRAEGSKAVVEAYKGGLEALKAISSKSPSLEEVEGLVGEVGEAIEKEEGLRAAANEIENIDERDMSENKRKLAEEQALLAQLENLTVHDSALSPVVCGVGRAINRGETGSPVAL